MTGLFVFLFVVPIVFSLLTMIDLMLTELNFGKLKLEIREEFDQKFQKTFYTLYKKRILFWHYVLTDMDILYVINKAEQTMLNSKSIHKSKVVKSYKET